jgi:hypothetical protein
LAALNIDCQVPGIIGSPTWFSRSPAGSKPTEPQTNRRRHFRGLSVSTARHRPRAIAQARAPLLTMSSC